MSRKIVAATAALATAATLVAAPAADAAGRGVTHLKVTKKHTVSAPATLRPGVVHLRNDGSRPVAVFRKKHEGSDRLVEYMNADKESVARRAYTRFGFVEMAVKGADSYVKLSRGTYFLVDVSGESVRAKGVRAVTVRGKGSNAHRPAYRSIRISKKGVLGGASTGGVKPYLRLHNGSKHARIVGALKVLASATDAKLREALADKSGRKLLDVIDMDGTSGLNGYLGAGQDITLATALRRGRYLLMSFAADGSSTNPFAPGTLRLFTVR